MRPLWSFRLCPKASGDVAAAEARPTQFFPPSPNSLTAANASASPEALAAKAAAPEGVTVDADLVKRPVCNATHLEKSAVVV